ncbi:MAG TPA: hypothetical protein VKA46_18380 [Gemmataceae bacterium]|nr:hypothetical protein [Gemmataceae bacterium]
MRYTPEFWRRFVTFLRTATEQDRLWWWESLDEPPRMCSYYPDGMVHLMLPEEGGSDHDVVTFGPWHEIDGVFHPEMPEDRALVESLYRVADRMKREREEDIHDIVRGRPVLKLQQIKRDIAKEVEGVNGGSGAVGVKARQ